MSAMSCLPAELETRCPRGSKILLYRKAKLEMFAEYLNQDGLVMRLTVYRDTASELTLTYAAIPLDWGGGWQRSCRSDL